MVCNSFGRLLQIRRGNLCDRTAAMTCCVMTVCLTRTKLVMNKLFFLFAFFQPGPAS